MWTPKMLTISMTGVGTMMEIALSVDWLLINKAGFVTVLPPLPNGLVIRPSRLSRINCARSAERYYVVDEKDI